MHLLLPIFCLSLHMAFMGHLFIIGSKLVGSKEAKDLESKLNEKQKEIYKEIKKERKNHYMYGLGLGMILAILYNYISGKNFKHMSCAYLGIATFVANQFYLLMPKKYWMIEYLEEKEDIIAWNNVYKKMRYLTTYANLAGFITFGVSQYYF